MGTYFNPGNRSYQRAVRSKIYVDKTGLIKHLNESIFSENNCIALSHARRFGKSQAARMIDAYYSLGSDSKELFSEFEIAEAPDFEEHLNKYNVIHLDISSFTDFYTDNLVEKLIEYLSDEFKKQYPGLDYSKKINDVIMQIYNESGIPFIIIIDEWDCVVRNHSDRPDLVHKYLQFLHSLFKSEESGSFLALAYITGILPIKKIDDESALNNFIEYTMVNSYELTSYFGFTVNEVKRLCERYEMDFESVKEWYNGYLVNGQHMYNPHSVYMAMVRKNLEPYWKNTAAFGIINRLIAMNFDGLKEALLEILDGGKVGVDVKKFKNDLSEINSKDDALTALIHLGYLGYDETCGKAYVPNFEVSLAFQSALSEGGWKDIAETISKCEELLWATIDGKEEKVAELLELAHETYTSVLTYNDENSLSCAITMAYFTAPAYYTIVRELPAGKGFADFAFIPRREAGSRPAMIVELKWDESADTAIRQIKEKRYEGALSGYGKEILLVGVSYEKVKSGDNEHKKHYCRIERI